MIVDDDEMIIDFSGCSPATRGPINCGEAAAVSAARVGFMSVTTPHLHANEGNFRALQVKVAPNSVVSVEEPGPTSAYGVPLVGLIDLIYAALAPAIPEKVGAGHFGDFCSFVLAGVNPYTGEPYVHAEGNLGGWGGKGAADGESGLMTLVNGDTRNAPIEVNRVPLSRAARKVRVHRGLWWARQAPRRARCRAGVQLPGPQPQGKYLCRENDVRALGSGSVANPAKQIIWC